MNVTLTRWKMDRERQRSAEDWPPDVLFTLAHFINVARIAFAVGLIACIAWIVIR